MVGNKYQSFCSSKLWVGLHNRLLGVLLLLLLELLVAPMALLFASTPRESSVTMSRGIMGGLYSQWPPSTTNVSPVT